MVQYITKRKLNNTKNHSVRRPMYGTKQSHRKRPNRGPKPNNDGLRIVDVNGPDTGNQSFKLATAINEHCKPHVSKSFVSSRNYLKFPHMVMRSPSWGLTLSWKGPAWIRKYWRNADVIHIHKLRRVCSVWPPYNPKAVKILHQHARMDTPASTIKSDKKTGTYRIVSTLNLLPWVNNNPDRWLPAPMDIPWFDHMKKLHAEPHDTIRVCQTATKLAVKRTDLFTAAMKGLMNKYDNVEMVLVQDTPWEECQRIKASCDILFDQVLSYGSTCLEQWCYGYPAVTAMSDQTYDIIENTLGKSNVPFIRAEESLDGISGALESLIQDENLRKEMGQKGRRYVEKWHSYPFVAKRAIAMYHEAGA